MDKQFWLERRSGFLVALAVLLLIIVAAYLDGGEEPVRPIKQEIDVPMPYTSGYSPADQDAPSNRSAD